MHDGNSVFWKIVNVCSILFVSSSGESTVSLIFREFNFSCHASMTIIFLISIFFDNSSDRYFFLIGDAWLVLSVSGYHYST